MRDHETVSNRNNRTKNKQVDKKYSRGVQNWQEKSVKRMQWARTQDTENHPN